MCLLCTQTQRFGAWESGALSVFLVLATGCVKDERPPVDTGTGPTLEAVCEAPAQMACEDALILNLGLQDDRSSDGELTSTALGDGVFELQVDASAGGLSQAPSEPWVYLRFGAEGAERVDIDDESALDSMDWHLAMRRFQLRLNGGSSGPSCVGALPRLEESFEAVQAQAHDADFIQDAFFTESCELINDTSGLPSSPQLALGPWWSYPGCVATTGVPFVVQLDDGQQLKLVVDSYYAEGQADCNSEGKMGTDSAHFTMRWGWLVQG